MLPDQLISVSPHIWPPMAVILLPSTCCLPAVEWTVFEDFTGNEWRELEEEEVICSSVHPPYETILIQVLCACHCYTFYLQLSYSLHFDFVFDFSKPLSHHVSFDVLYEDVADSILKKLNIWDDRDKYSVPWQWNVNVDVMLHDYIYNLI